MPSPLVSCHDDGGGAAPLSGTPWPDRLDGRLHGRVLGAVSGQDRAPPNVAGRAAVVVPRSFELITRRVAQPGALRAASAWLVPAPVGRLEVHVIAGRPTDAPLRAGGGHRRLCRLGCPVSPSAEVLPALRLFPPLRVFDDWEAVHPRLLARRHRGRVRQTSAVLGMVCSHPGRTRRLRRCVRDHHRCRVDLRVLRAGLPRSRSEGRAEARRRGGGGHRLAQILVLALSKAPANYGGPTLQLTHLLHPHSIQAQQALEQPLNALLPLPNLDVHFWNTFVVDNLASGLVIVLSLAAVVAIAWALRSDRSAQVLWLVTVVMTVAFLDAGSETSSRFVGTIFVGVVAAFWIHPDVPLARPRSALIVILTVLLVLQIPGGIVARRSPPRIRSPKQRTWLRWSAICQALSLPRPTTPRPRQRLRQSPALHGPSSELRHLYDLEQPDDLCTHTVSVQGAGTAGHQPRSASPEPARPISCSDFPLQNRVPRITLCRAFRGATNPTEDYWLYSVDHATCPPDVSPTCRSRRVPWNRPRLRGRLAAGWSTTPDEHPATCPWGRGGPNTAHPGRARTRDHGFARQP